MNLTQNLFIWNSELSGIKKILVGHFRHLQNKGHVDWTNLNSRRHPQDNTVGDSSLHPHDDQQLAVREQKQLWDCSGVHLRNFNNTGKQQTWEQPPKKEWKNSFILPATSPTGQHCLAKRRQFPPGVSVSHKGEQVKHPLPKAFRP